MGQHRAVLRLLGSPLLSAAAAALAAHPEGEVARALLAEPDAVPAAEAPLFAAWDEKALLYSYADQSADRFAVAVTAWAQAAGSAANPSVIVNDVTFEACARGAAATEPPVPVVSPLQALQLEHDAIGLAGPNPSPDQIQDYQCFAGTMIDDPLLAPLLVAETLEQPGTTFRTNQGGEASVGNVTRVLASDIAAMAPNTSIGAAHPVSVGGSSEKVDEVMKQKLENFRRELRRGGGAFVAELRERLLALVAEFPELLLGLLGVRAYFDFDFVAHERQAFVAARDSAKMKPFRTASRSTPESSTTPPGPPRAFAVWSLGATAGSRCWATTSVSGPCNAASTATAPASRLPVCRSTPTWSS